MKYDDSVSTISNQFQVLKRGVYTIRKEGDEYKIAYYNPETQESAPDQEVFKKLEQAAQPQVQNSKEKEKSEEGQISSDFSFKKDKLILIFFTSLCDYSVLKLE